MSEWDKIDGVEGWSEKLGELLADARVAAQQKDLTPRLKVNERLMQFVENSWPNTDEIKALDDIATQSASALMRQTIDERLESISERTGAYQQLAKQFKTLAEENQTKAESIRLQAVISFIDSATKAITAAKDLQGVLKDDAGDAKLAEKLAEAIGAIEELRSSVAKRI
jgi:hypothetical protein